MQDSVISARDIVKHYGDTLAVDGITFRVKEGECYGLLGPNGAGKTTVLRALYNYTPLTAGSITILGMDIKGHQRRIKRLMGVVPQEDNLDPDLTVLENLIVYARYFDLARGEARTRAQELLEFFQLADRKQSRIRQISAGMKRRLILARALLNQPRIVILDEPTTGLDPQARHLIWQRLRHLKRGGTTLFLTTHYMEEASQLCDRLAVLDCGKMLVEGEPGALVREHVGEEVVEVRAPAGGAEVLLQDLALRNVPSERAGDTLYLFPTDGRETVRRLLEHHVERSRLLLRPATVEDLFLKLTGRGLRE